MPKMFISRKKIVNAPISKVYDSLSNMGQWKEWSPWLIMEPDVHVEVHADLKQYAWEGQRVGSGYMVIVNQEQEKRIDYNLNFLKPWKSHAAVTMHLEPKDEQTEIIWEMNSSLPFFMFWMKGMMEAYVGSDYDRGLLMFKDYIEDGKVHSKLNFIGEQIFPETDYIAIKRDTTMDKMPELMKQDFVKLMDFTEDKNQFRPQDSMSMYNKWNLPKNTCSFTCAIPYNGTIDDLPTDFSIGTIPKIKTYTIEHTGPYTHLGNAWSTLYAMHRNKEFKTIKNVFPFETYGNSPVDTDPKDLITTLHFPMK
jgi:effector-binding domain-containing protein